MASLRFCSSALLILGLLNSHPAHAASESQTQFVPASGTPRQIAVVQTVSVTTTGPHLRHGSWYLRPGDRLVDGRQIAAPADVTEARPQTALERVNAMLPNWLRW